MSVMPEPRNWPKLTKKTMSGIPNTSDSSKNWTKKTAEEAELLPRTFRDQVQDVVTSQVRGEDGEPADTEGADRAAETGE